MGVGGSGAQKGDYSRIPENGSLENIIKSRDSGRKMGIFEPY